MNSLEKKKYSFLCSYSLLFCLSSFIIFSWYFLAGKSFVYDGDGTNQYLPIYIFWSRYLRTVFKNIFILHDFIIPQWDFSIGEGADIISTLSYNIVGDPFCFFSFLVPAQYMYIYYSAMSLLRLYCAGLAFAYTQNQGYTGGLQSMDDLCIWNEHGFDGYDLSQDVLRLGCAHFFLRWLYSE